jgi:hypothetical protein
MALHRALLVLGAFLAVRKFVTAAMALISLSAIKPLTAQMYRYTPHCGFVGQTICVNGEIYKCEQTADQITAISKNRPCPTNNPSIVGVWRGQGYQVVTDATASHWPIEMTIRDGAGTIEYPSLGCGGDLARVSQVGTSTQYRETITHGSNCLSGAAIIVDYLDGKLTWTWIWISDEKRYVSIATLTR